MKQYRRSRPRSAAGKGTLEQMHCGPLSTTPCSSGAMSMEKRIERMRTGPSPPRKPCGTPASPSREFRATRFCPSRDSARPLAAGRCFRTWTCRWRGASASPCWATTAPASPPCQDPARARRPVRQLRLGPPRSRRAYLPQIIHFDHPERKLLDTMLYESRTCSAQTARNRLAAYQFRGRTCSSRVRPVRRRAEPPAAVYADG